MRNKAETVLYLPICLPAVPDGEEVSVTVWVYQRLKHPSHHDRFEDSPFLEPGQAFPTLF